jgi:AcrR family transcriptional regulator
MVSPEKKDTRERILEAAAEAFSRLGFKAATVREICKQADANVAMLNYYFKDKESLYQAVIQDLFARAFGAFPKPESMAALPPEARLSGFIRILLLRLLSERGLGGYYGSGKLLAREIADPSPAMDQVVEGYLKAQKQFLASVIAEILGPTAPRELVMRCALSVVGQCLHLAIARPLLDRLEIDAQSGDQAIEQLAAHVARFSLGGLRAAREELLADNALSSPPSFQQQGERA